MLMGLFSMMVFATTVRMTAFVVFDGVGPPNPFYLSLVSSLSDALSVRAPPKTFRRPAMIPFPGGELPSENQSQEGNKGLLLLFTSRVFCFLFYSSPRL